MSGVRFLYRIDTVAMQSFFINHVRLRIMNYMHLMNERRLGLHAIIFIGSQLKTVSCGVTFC
jgi:hypothetical protein